MTTSPSATALLRGHARTAGSPLALLCTFGAERAGAQERPLPDDSTHAVEALLDVLKDDAARAALVARLEEQATTPADPTQTTLAEGLAQTAGGIGTALRNEVEGIWREMARLFDGGLAGELLRALGAEEWLALGLTILSTVTTILLAGLFFRQWRRTPLDSRDFAERLFGTLGATALRLLALFLAWSVGMILSLTLFDRTDRLFDLQALYLSTFAIFGLARIALAVVASPEAETGRSLTTVDPDLQRALYLNVVPVLGLVIQGYLFVLPVIQDAAGFATLRPARTLIATVAALAALWAVIAVHAAHRRSVAETTPSAAANSPAAGQRVQRAWVSIWPWPVVIAVLYSWFVAVTQPLVAAEIVTGGVGASLAGMLLLAGAFKCARSLPDPWIPMLTATRHHQPDLIRRLKVVMRFVLMAGAVALSLGTIAVLADGWGFIDVRAVLGETVVRIAIWRIISVALVGLAAIAIWATVASIIDRRLGETLPGAGQNARRRTILRLSRTAFTVVVATLGIMVALSQAGIDIAPLLAGAGVVGLAVGFGAQKLVQDVITGLFIQLENAVNEGDVVSVAGVSGAVERVSLRTIRLRALDGTLHVVPFSSVETVSNMTRDRSYHVAEIGVAYKENVGEVKTAMAEAFDRLKAEDNTGRIRGGLDMHGVIALADSAVVVRARIETEPGAQWGIGRRYTELVKDVMDDRGIEIPYPHRQLVLQGLPEGLFRPMPELQPTS